MVCNNGWYLKRFYKAHPVSTSFISNKPEDFEYRCRANLFLYMHWRRLTDKKVDAEQRYQELEELLLNNFSTYQESWEDFLSKHRDEEWMQVFFIQEAIQKAERIAEVIEKERVEATQQESAQEDHRHVDEEELQEFDVYDEEEGIY